MGRLSVRVSIDGVIAEANMILRNMFHALFVCIRKIMSKTWHPIANLV
jgi:hypothetical protein